MICISQFKVIIFANHFTVNEHRVNQQDFMNKEHAFELLNNFELYSNQF